MSNLDNHTSPAPAPPFSQWSWVLTLFGTAVGAGILYLPIQVGLTGLWSLVFLSIFLFPLIYYSHKNIITMLLDQPGEADYANILASRFGHFFGEGIVIVYFLTFYVLLFSYLVGLTDNLADFLMILGVTSTHHGGAPWLSFLVVVCFAVLYLIGAKVIVPVMSAVSLALLLLLLGISVYLVPFWNITHYLQTPSLFQFTDDILLVLPILTLSFIFFSALSSMVVTFRVSSEARKINGAHPLNYVLLKTTALLLIFVLLFVFSCLFSLTTDEFKHAAATNLDCLALLSAKKGISPFIAKISPVIGLAALVTSFIGVFFAVQESALQLTERFLARVRRNGKKARPSAQRSQRLNIAVLLFLFISLWILTLFHPSLMNLFGLVISPLIAIFLFLLPTIVLIRIHGFAMLKKPSISVVLLTGILILFSFKLGKLLQILAK